jgi:CRP/FNR family cyclic AMP-dependent transcriptional regulator
MKRKRRKPVFDPKAFLAKADGGRTISKYQKDQIVFCQGEAADAVFYIQQGKIKITVVSEQGREAVVAILGPRCRATTLKGGRWRSVPAGTRIEEEFDETS